MLPMVADWEGRFGAVLGGGGRYRCPQSTYNKSSDATYRVPDASPSHPVWGTTSVRLRLPRSNLPMQGTDQQNKRDISACAVLSVRILVCQTSPSPASAPLPPRTWSDQLFCTMVQTRRHPCPGNRASALPSGLPSASLCSSREIIAPNLHGVASTILLIRVGVC